MEYAFLAFGALLIAFFAYDLLVAPCIALFGAKKQPIQLTKRQIGFRNRLMIAVLATAVLSLATWWLGRDYWW